MWLERPLPQTLNSPGRLPYLRVLSSESLLQAKELSPEVWIICFVIALHREVFLQMSLLGHFRITSCIRVRKAGYCNGQSTNLSSLQHRTELLLISWFTDGLQRMVFPSRGRESLYLMPLLSSRASEPSARVFVSICQTIRGKRVNVENSRVVLGASARSHLHHFCLHSTG